MFETKPDEKSTTEWWYKYKVEEKIMTKVFRRVADWCDIDELDGKTIVHGESLEVKFPNGKLIQLKAHVEERKKPYSDHGHEYTMPESLAYHKSFWAGAPVKISLTGLEARRIT